MKEKNEEEEGWNKRRNAKEDGAEYREMREGGDGKKRRKMRG